MSTLKLKKILKIDKDVDEIIEDQIDEIFDFIEKANHPNTVRAFLRLLISSDNIKDGILYLSEKNELYSIHILYRSLIEQFVKSFYIMIRYLREKNDVCGTEFIEISDLDDKIKNGMSYNKMLEIRYGKRMNIHQMLEVFKEVNSDFIKYSNDEIKAKSRQFKFTNLLEWLYKNSQKSENKDYFAILLMIPEYSELSSVVHGNPSAFSNLPEYDNDKDLENICIKMAYKTLGLSNFIKRMAFQSFSFMDNKYEVTLKQIEEQIKRFKLLKQ